MEEEIKHQKAKLLRKLDLLKNRQDENKLLTAVVEDYKAFEKRLSEKEEEINQQKQAHEQHLKMLNAYILDIIETNDLTDSGIKRLDHENQKILKLMDSIRNKIVK